MLHIAIYCSVSLFSNVENSLCATYKHSLQNKQNKTNLQLFGQFIEQLVNRQKKCTWFACKTVYMFIKMFLVVNFVKWNMIVEKKKMFHPSSHKTPSSLSCRHLIPSTPYTQWHTHTQWPTYTCTQYTQAVLVAPNKTLTGNISS